MWGELCLHPPPLNYPRPPARPVVAAETLRHWAEMNSRWRASLVMTLDPPIPAASSHLGSVRVTLKDHNQDPPFRLSVMIVRDKHPNSQFNFMST